MTSTSSLHVYYNTFSTRRKAEAFLFFQRALTAVAGGFGALKKTLFS
ncbi:PcfI [Enterococcus faecalis]|nr:PcfI [Enterococcus faecalis]RNA54877.1 PcfI [Enterococcus faecalis]RNA59386.1 PcfI [Enterococcus faecalis]